MSIDSISTASLARTDLSYGNSDTAATRVRAPAQDSQLAGLYAGQEGTAPDQLNQAVAELNKSPQAKQQGLEFSIDKDTDRIVVKVVDQESREVLRQMPTEEALRIAKSLDSGKSLLLNLTA